MYICVCVRVCACMRTRTHTHTHTHTVLAGPFEKEAEALGDEEHRHLGLQARDVFENDQQLAAQVQEALIELLGVVSKSTLQSVIKVKAPVFKTKQHPNYYSVAGVALFITQAH
jgi:hypothetical protein